MGLLKLQLTIRRAEDDGPVYWKPDGERFDNKVTVKLNDNTKYSVFITTRPARTITKLTIRGEVLPLDQQKPEQRDDNCSIHHSEWSSLGLEVTRAGSRLYVPVLIQMEGGACVQSVLQVKIYPEKENSRCKWGEEFHILDIDCNHHSNDQVTVVKQQYI